MRKIKFRAWDKKTEKMIYLRDMETTISIGNHLCFGCEEWGHSYESRCIDENFEIMQFTERKDKNGKDIYGRDIVKVYGSISADDPAYGNYEPEHEIIWEQPTCSWILADGGRLVNYNEYEIVGNIHENKELLK